MRPVRSRVDSLLADLRYARRRLGEVNQRLAVLEDRHRDLMEARAILQQVAEEVQTHSHRAVAGLVTRCLKAVFGEDSYEFRIKFEPKRGKTEAELVLVKDGREVSPTAGVGGGVTDVVSFALRLSCLLLSRPARRRLLVLDEPCRHLSRDYQSRVRDLFLVLADECGVQIVFVTHSDEMACGKVVDL